MIKLKGLSARLYSVMFHTHSVTGIVISFALFVIFYAGAFSLFREELYKWENPLARIETKHDLDLDATIKLFNSHKKEEHNGFKRFIIKPPSNINPLIRARGTYKKPQGKSRFITYYINPHTEEFYKEPHKFNEPRSLTYMADTIYKLHHFKHIPNIGVRLAGLVSFLFLFAIIGGVLIHWKNIINKFYDFRIKGKWKQIWANTHTVLGTITLPFQLIFAVTGVFIALRIFLITPTAFLLLDGNENEIKKLVTINAGRKYNKNAKDITNSITINSLYKKVTETYPNHHVNRIQIDNYGKEDGTVLFTIDDEKGIAGDGKLFFSTKNGSLIDEIVPDKKSYTEGVFFIFKKLHYSRFGGYLLKVIYFILAMLTCYVITSGVMAWQTARNTSKYTDKQKNFHYWVTKFYLAFTTSLFPAVVLIFIANKFFPITMEYRVVYVKNTFFIGWLLFTIISLLWDNYGKLNRNNLLIGSFLALLIPISNGIVTEDWLWKTFSNKQYYVFSTDFSWLITSVLGLIIYANLKSSKNVVTT